MPKNYKHSKVYTDSGNPLHESTISSKTVQDLTTGSATVSNSIQMQQEHHSYHDRGLPTLISPKVVIAQFAPGLIFPQLMAGLITTARHSASEEIAETRDELSAPQRHELPGVENGPQPTALRLLCPTAKVKLSQSKLESHTNRNLQTNQGDCSVHAKR
jgi:hypothetical protein